MDLKTLVSQKDVLVVGNGSDIKNKGHIIDSYEFVVLFNYGIKYNIGKKCSLWIYAMVSETAAAQVYKNAKVSPEICGRFASPCTIEIGKNFMDLRPERGRAYSSLMKKLNLNQEQNPSTGISFIYTLTEECDPKSITLMGFDSFKTPNFYSSSIHAGLWHDSKKEAEYIKELVSKEKVKII